MVESGAVCLVTGGVRGLGLAAARLFAERGDRVHLVYRGSLELAREREREHPGRVHRADLTEEGTANRVVEDVLQRDGRLDHVVHAVGDYASGSVEATPREVWRELFRSNVESAILVAHAARRALRESAGDLVFFGCAGLAGLRGRRTAAAYAAAKSALLVLVRSLALEEAPYGVRVNMVSPGIVPHEHAHRETRDPRRAASIPFGRVGTPEEVAQAVLWLASPAASYVTGVDLPVAGGWMD